MDARIDHASETKWGGLCQNVPIHTLVVVDTFVDRFVIVILA
jgi:hypothetical protein